MSAKKSNPLAGMASTVTDGMEMMRRMWGMTGLPQIPQLPTPAGIAQFAQGLPQALPSMITPTLDIGELDKRITDLRAVEQWLNLNATMLRTTIQTLEVQRNTIATLKTFGGNMLASMTPRGGTGEPKMPVAAGAAPVDNAAGADWPPQRLRHDMTAPTEPAAAQVAPARPAPKAQRKRKAAKGGASTAATGMPVNPAAWWGALQDQFARVAAAAVTPPRSAAPKAATGKAVVGQSAAGKASKAPARKAAPRSRRKTDSSSG